MAANYTQCRYLRRNDEQCTAEAIDPDADMLLCSKHLAAAMRTYQDAATSLGRRDRDTA